MSFMRAIMGKVTFFVFLAILSSSGPVAASIRLADDGFPCGNETPEGAACDFARAFIHHDPVPFLAISLKPYGDPSVRHAYGEYLQSVISQMKEEANRTDPSALGPQSIAACFAARHPTEAEPVVYAQTVLGFEDVMFVDVKVNLQNGESQICRTLAIKQKNRWNVHPRPDLSPRLMTGINKETPSSENFADAYGAK
jgi:hypothetical protein